MNVTRAASALVLTIGVVIVLIYGQSLLIPFVFALLIWFLTMKIRSLLNMVPFIKRRFPNWIKTLVTSVILLGFLGFIGTILTASINSLAQSYDQYGQNVNVLVDQINDTFQINLGTITQDFFADFDFGSILESIFSSLTGLLGNAFMIIVYLLFVFLESASFPDKIRSLCKTEERYESVRQLLHKLEHSITGYIGVKTLVSLITGILSYLVLALIGLQSPVFWAFLIFLLNFIPNIGSLVATGFPAIFSLLQFGDFQPFFLILIFVGAIQLIVGNYLEPRIMGNSLNISALVTILALSFWGAIWGITGMFLSVPITVMMVIVFAQFPSTRPIAIMLSEKGKV